MQVNRCWHCSFGSRQQCIAVLRELQVTGREWREGIAVHFCGAPLVPHHYTSATNRRAAISGEGCLIRRRSTHFEVYLNGLPLNRLFFFLADIDSALRLSRHRSVHSGTHRACTMEWRSTLWFCCWFLHAAPASETPAHVLNMRESGKCVAEGSSPSLA